MIQTSVIINYDRINLTRESSSIIENSESFEKLRLPLNSTVGHSQVLSQFRVTRHEHSIHAAKQAHLLRNADLTSYELKCLELALLLHDLGHTLGSHSIDKLYYSMADSPQIAKFGYTEQDYHEYHTVELVQGQEFKDLFKHNPTLLSDVIAVLSYDDKRPFEQKCKGFPGSTLSPEQTKMLYDLKDWLDRVSYLELEYLASGAPDEIVATAVTQLAQFKNTIEIHNKQLIFRNNTAVENIISLRERLFEETVYHPLACAYDEYIKRNISNSCHTYQELKEAAFTNPEMVFAPELYEVLMRRTDRCLSQELTPLLIVDHYFLTDIGLNAFSEYSNNQYQGFTQSVLKRPFSASYAELLINMSMGPSAELDLYTMIAKRPLKEYNYTALVNNVPTEVNKICNSSAAPTIIIALRNAESTAQIQTVKDKIEQEFIKRKWVRPDLNFNLLYDQDIFKSNSGSILKKCRIH